MEHMVYHLMPSICYVNCNVRDCLSFERQGPQLLPCLIRASEWLRCHLACPALKVIASQLSDYPGSVSSFFFIVIPVKAWKVVAPQLPEGRYLPAVKSGWTQSGEISFECLIRRCFVAAAVAMAIMVEAQWRWVTFSLREWWSGGRNEGPGDVRSASPCIVLPLQPSIYRLTDSLIAAPYS